MNPDVARENRELHRLRAQRQAVLEVVNCDVDRITATQLAKVIFVLLGGAS